VNLQNPDLVSLKRNYSKAST